MIKFIDFETIDPMMAITKLGAGEKLYALAEDERGNIIAIRSDGITLQDVARFSEEGKRFILVK